MKNHRYTLEPYKGKSSRYHCPICQQREKTFSRYIDTETGEHIHPTVGRCNRESNCGHHYTPKQYFQDNNISFDKPQPKAYKLRPVPPQPKPVSFIPVEVFKASLNPTAFEKNHFVTFLIERYGVEVASELVSRYFIATSKHWKGATVFWQIDLQGKVRTGKIIQYEIINSVIGKDCKRVKTNKPPVYWVHTALKITDTKQCLFGEHLLTDNTMPVALVESEKTAVIASVYLPQFIWLAVGSLSYLNADKCSILKGRTVVLFPDLNGFEKWSSKAKELGHLAKFKVSDLLERKATEAERKQGLDLADYLLRFDLLEFNPPAIETVPEPPQAIEPLFEVQPEAVCIQSEPESWEQALQELEKHFAAIAIPTQPIKLDTCTTITDCPLFIESHIATVKANNGKPTFLPYLNRLQALSTLLK